MRAILGAVTQFIATLLLAAVALGYGAVWSHALDIVCHFRLHLALAALPVVVLALAVRRWSAAWRGLVALVLAVAGLSPVWERPTLETQGRPLSVLTANLLHDNPRTEEMVGALRVANADILVTHETTKAALTATHPLSDLYPYRLALSTRGRILRTVIWSKHPMRDGTLLLEDTVEPTGAIAIVQLPDGREVSVVGLHLAHAWPGNQDRQIAVLGEITAGLPRPMIVMGDFNAAPWSQAMVRVQRLTGTRRIPGYRVTWHGTYPPPLEGIPALLGHAIDHILLSPGLGIGNVTVVAIPGSDHDAVGATIRLPDA